MLLSDIPAKPYTIHPVHPSHHFFHQRSDPVQNTAMKYRCYQASTFSGRHRVAETLNGMRICSLTNWFNSDNLGICIHLLFHASWFILLPPLTTLTTLPFTLHPPPNPSRLLTYSPPCPHAPLTQPHMPYSPPPKRYLDKQNQKLKPKPKGKRAARSTDSETNIFATPRNRVKNPKSQNKTGRLP